MRWLNRAAKTRNGSGKGQWERVVGEGRRGSGWDGDGGKEDGDGWRFEGGGGETKGGSAVDILAWSALPVPFPFVHAMAGGREHTPALAGQAPGLTSSIRRSSGFLVKYREGIAVDGTFRDEVEARQGVVAIEECPGRFRVRNHSREKAEGVSALAEVTEGAIAHGSLGASPVNRVMRIGTYGACSDLVPDAPYPRERLSLDSVSLTEPAQDEDEALRERPASSALAKTAESVKERRLRKRWGAVRAIKGKLEYAHARESSRARGGRLPRPQTPDPTNLCLSKRKWEKSVQIWRTQLKGYPRSPSPIGRPRQRCTPSSALADASALAQMHGV